MGASVIIAAAGSASRMNGTDKLMYRIGSREIFMFSVLEFNKAKCTDKIVVVTSEDKIEAVKACLEKAKLRVPYEVVFGGDTRQKSVLNGLKACLDSSECVMIHDAARPMITKELIEKIYSKVIVEGLDAAALGVAVKDTIKQVDADEGIESTPQRSSLRIAQTPQVFEMSLYKKAFQEAQKNGKDYTDDCQLVEAIGKKVYIVDSDYRNIKITTPEDLILAEVYLKERV